MGGDAAGSQAPRPTDSAPGSRRHCCRRRRPRPNEMSRAARQDAASRWAVPGPAGRRAGSQAGGVRAERAGAGELCVAWRHLASPRPACFPEPRAPPRAQAQDRFSGPPFF